MSIVRGRQRALRLGALLSLIVAACVPPTHTTGATRSSRIPGEIRRAEIDAEAGRFATAYEIVRTLRPNMLVSRDFSARPKPTGQHWQATHGIKVYLDGVPYGGVGSLASIPANAVLEIHWLSALDATTRYGTGHAAGVVAVTSRTARP
jgi:hypothetical protein